MKEFNCPDCTMLDECEIEVCKFCKRNNIKVVKEFVPMYEFPTIKTDPIWGKQVWDIPNITCKLNVDKLNE